MSIHETVPEHKEVVKLNVQRYVLNNLESVLLKGKKNCRTGRVISVLLDIPVTSSHRAIRRAAKILFQRGIPVIACDDGFFIAETYTEMDDYVNKLEKIAEGINRDLCIATELSRKMFDESMDKQHYVCSECHMSEDEKHFVPTNNQASLSESASV